MHIYYYAAYERTALARLTGRYGTREAMAVDVIDILGQGHLAVLASVGKVVNCDGVEGWIDVSMAAKTEPVVPRGFGPPGPLFDGVLRGSIADTGHSVLAGEHGMAARLVAGVVPVAEVLAVRHGETPAQAVVRVGLALDGQVLAVQGPPGTGKTHAAA